MTGMTSHYGLTREPFTKNLTTAMLHHHHGHDEAAARITWCIQDIGNHRYQNVLNDPLRDTLAA
jgi:type II secretory pathway predicted ATPase ExeA